MALIGLNESSTPVPTPLTTPIPAPGEAPLPAANAAALLRRNATDPQISNRPAMRFGDRVWTHGEYVTESIRWANLLLRLRVPDRPFHIGVLLDNTPDYLFAFGGSALSGATVVGLNHTRQGDHLLRDIVHTDLVAVVTEPRHQAALAAIGESPPFDPDRVLVSHRYVTDRTAPAADAIHGRDLDEALIEVGTDDAGIEPDVMTPWALIFTSGTSAAPKAVICSQKRLLQTGARMAMIMDLGPDDVGYVCMPLFHSNAVMVGWMPSLVAGCSVALAPRFSASGWLRDVRRYRATYFNYTGKPLAYVLGTPEQVDDSDNSLRVAFGNEGAPEVVDAFSRRFAVRVIEVFGATEGGIALERDAPARQGAMGLAPPHIKVVDEQGAGRDTARFDTDGRLANPDDCVGEIVNTNGAGPFEGYYNNPEATAEAMRRGWYWSGDLGYLDDDRYLYFAGRNADWIRVDGENFPARPIEAALGRHPDVVVAAAYGVPDDQAGDQVMVALVMKHGAAFEPVGFADWIDALPDIGPKWRPRYVRVSAQLPSTGTNKIVKRTLVHQHVRRDRVGDDDLFVRERGAAGYRPFTAEDEEVLAASFAQHGRARFWDL